VEQVELVVEVMVLLQMLQDTGLGTAGTANTGGGGGGGGGWKHLVLVVVEQVVKELLY
jgi:hypothetical protein